MTTAMTPNEQTQDLKQCPVCKQMGNMRPLEKLPDTMAIGTINVIEHPDGQAHKFAMIDVMGPRGVGIKKKPGKANSLPTVDCPLCHQKGLARTRDKWKPSMPETERWLHFYYNVVHKDKDGKPFEHSCMPQERRDSILQQLDRYYSSPPESLKKKRGRPRKLPAGDVKHRKYRKRKKSKAAEAIMKPAQVYGIGKLQLPSIARTKTLFDTVNLLLTSIVERCPTEKSTVEGIRRILDLC